MAISPEARSLGSRPSAQDANQIFLVDRLLILRSAGTLWIIFDGDEFSIAHAFFYDSLLAECETAEDWRGIGTIGNSWGSLGYPVPSYRYTDLFALELNDVTGNYIFVVVRLTTHFTVNGEIDKTKVYTQEMVAQQADRLLSFLTNRLYTS